MAPFLPLMATRWPATTHSESDSNTTGILRIFAKGVSSVPYIYNLSKKSTEPHSFTGTMPSPAQAGNQAMILKLQPEHE